MINYKWEKERRVPTDQWIEHKKAKQADIVRNRF